MPALSPENTGGSFKSLFGRLFGLCGDESTATSHRHIWLGVPGATGRIVASTRKDIVTSFTGLNGAGAVTLTGTNTGDIVLGVGNVTDGSDATSSYESVITVAGQIQQSSASDLSSKKMMVHVSRQS
jgi:hypothetical protein